MPGPVPPELKLLRGTAQPCREVKDAPSFDLVTTFPPPPQHLDADGAAAWQELGPQLVMAGVLQVVDLYALEQLCFSWARFRKKAKAQMEITASEDQTLKALFSEFGMTPASRRKVSAGGKAENANKFKGIGQRSDKSA